MSALWRELAQIKTSGPIPQASDSISWGWGPGIGVSDEPLGDADAGGLGGTGKPRGFEYQLGSAQKRLQSCNKLPLTSFLCHIDGCS